MNGSSLLRCSFAFLAMGVLSSVGQAALITQALTADTITGQPPDAFRALNDGSALTQTFTGAGALGDVTFRFLVGSAGVGSVSAANVDFMITSWGANDSAGSVVGMGSFALDAGTSWTDGGLSFHYFDSTVDMSAFGPISASTTYGISLFGNLATSAGGIGLSQSLDTAYASGTAFEDPAVTFGDVSSLGSGNYSLGNDFSFSAIGASSSPVPEASTAAVLFAGVFVGGLMVRRRSRHPADAVPVAQA